MELAQAQQHFQHLGGAEQRLENPSHSCVVTMKEMATVIANDASSSSLKDDSLPLQQKLVVCTLVVLARGSSTREVSLAQLQDGYRRVCERRQLKAESDGELVALCGYLETVGIIAVKGKRNEPRLAKVGYGCCVCGRFFFSFGACGHLVLGQVCSFKVNLFSDYP